MTKGAIPLAIAQWIFAGTALMLTGILPNSVGLLVSAVIIVVAGVLTLRVNNRALLVLIAGFVVFWLSIFNAIAGIDLSQPTGDCNGCYEIGSFFKGLAYLFLVGGPLVGIGFSLVLAIALKTFLRSASLAKAEGTGRA